MILSHKGPETASAPPIPQVERDTAPPNISNPHQQDKAPDSSAIFRVEFRPIRPLWFPLRISLYFWMIVCVVQISGIAGFYPAFLSIQDGVQISEIHLLFYDYYLEHAEKIDTVSTGLFIISAILYSRFIYRSLRNFKAIASTEVTIGPVFGVASAAIPILHLFGPYIAMRQIWKGSHASLQRDPPASAAFGWWWAMWIIAGFAAGGASVASNQSETAAEFSITLFNWIVGLSALAIAAQIMSILALLAVVRHVTVAHDAVALSIRREQDKVFSSDAFESLTKGMKSAPA
jgi:hypothetical protein